MLLNGRGIFSAITLLVSSSFASYQAFPGDGAGGTEWATKEQEAMDEKHDAQLYQAVLQSVLDWQAQHRNHTRRRQKRAEENNEGTICYTEVGCFSDGGYLDMLPSPPEVVSTRFLVYSARGGRRPHTPHLDLAASNMSTLDVWAAKALDMSLPTKVIVHGFGSSCSHVWVYEMRSALMSVENCNVVCVDWEPGASFPNYVRAAANTRLVGRQLSLLLAGLRDKHGLDLSTVHVIGFSLGAHAAAFAGAHLGTLKRITGLDPAGPLFESQEASLRLDRGDAKFVDVIHSNGEALILGGLGSWQPMGHVDFYPNGGRMQNGCSHLFVGAFTDILWSGAALEGRSLCNHRRAYKFFTDSVSPRCKFPAVPCKSYEAYLAGECFPCPQGASCPSMGYYADVTGAEGTLYLVTRDEEPFCAHQYLVQVQSSPLALPVVSYGRIQLTLITDGQINETFTLTSKDDQELAVGSTLSKIIVPHPALERFSAAALLYTAYAGWISSGLAKWSIDSLTLTDSLGNKMSVCSKELVLESGVPAMLPLSHGDCNNITSVTNVTSTTASANTTNPITSTVTPSVETTTPIPLTTKETSSRYEHRSGLEWEPVLEVPEASGSSGNGVDGGITGRRLGAGREIREPLLPPTRPPRRTPDERWFPNPDLSPPAMGATASWRHWDPSTTPAPVKPVEDNRSFASSLPQRLAQVVERYARMALAPFREDRSMFRRFSWLLPAALLSWGATEPLSPSPRHLGSAPTDVFIVDEATNTTDSVTTTDAPEVVTTVNSTDVEESTKIDVSSSR